jgi:hypothetical protein
MSTEGSRLLIESMPVFEPSVLFPRVSSRCTSPPVKDERILSEGRRYHPAHKRKRRLQDRIILIGGSFRASAIGTPPAYRAHRPPPEPERRIPGQWQNRL